MLILYIAAGGLVGTVLRYALGGWVHTWSGTWLPWGTLLVNMLGCLVLGFIMRWTQVVLISPETRALLTIGFCGAFTTFSTLSYETFMLVQEGAWLRAGLYSLGSLLTGFVALAVGVALAAALSRTGG